MIFFQIYEGETWKELQKFKHYLTQKSKTYTRYHIDKLLEIYSWFVLPTYRGKGLLTIKIFSVEQIALNNLKY